MSEKYFQNALADFTVDFAAGGAIRVMADKGYTVGEIKEKLDYPHSKKKIAELVWKHYLETGVIRLTPPEEESAPKRVHYEKVQDRFGKTSFRQVVSKEESGCGNAGNSNGSDNNGNCKYEYVACDFGKRLYQNRKAFEKSLEVLSEKDREYILDLPWPLQTVWHIKDERMERIARCLSLLDQK